MIFKKLELDDANIILPFLKKRGSGLSDFSLGGIFMWRDYLKTEYAIEDGTLFLKAVYPKEAPSFCLPFGENEEKDIRKIFDYCNKNDLQPFFFAVSSCELKKLEENFEILHTVSDRDSFDYFYKADDLKYFSGKKFHGQKNHINKFKKENPNHSFEEITEKNIGQIKEFFEVYSKENTKDNILAKEERIKVCEVLDNIEKYGFFGLVLKVKDKIVGMTFGEAINDTLFVHIEKADKSINGAYQMLVSEFAKRYATGDIQYINRGDDVGDEGLRRSKLSYQPIEILEKHTVLLGDIR
ncbi:MAG: DUF2156 domain-containing protein [Ruminococcaceae bacterium]|nr:DUF2156 domain-containing protein [Oscillospiraceae bacterium]